MGREIGIDLGTTNTIVSFKDKWGRIQPLKLRNEYIIPSVLFFKSRDEYIIGSVADHMGFMNVKACVRDFKSHFDDVKYRYEVYPANGDSSFRLSPKQAASLFLSRVISEMQDKVEEQFRGADDNYIDKAVITVPAKFNATEREVVLKAARAANLENVELMAEPTAGAIAYMCDYDLKDRTILVYDFGGGTFDLSVLEINNGICTVLNTDGDKKLGGNNITNAIMDFILDYVNNCHDWYMPLDIDNYDSDECTLTRDSCLMNLSEIRRKSNEIKELISDGDTEFDETLLLIDENGDEITEDFFCTVSELNRCIKKYINKTIEITSRMLDWANENNKKIDNIILAGGSSQLPEIRKKLSELFPEVLADADVSLLISKGAAYVANEQFSGSYIQERTNAEIGIKSRMGSVYDAFKTIIPDNTPLPYTGYAEFAIVDETKEFSETSVPAENTGPVNIEIFERDAKRKDRDITIKSDSVSKLDEITLYNLPSDNGRTAKIKITAKSDGSMDISVDIFANGRIISENHSYKKESNLL